LTLAGCDAQVRGDGEVGFGTQDGAIAFQQDEDQQFQIALGQRLESLQQGQAQEFVGEPGRVLEFDGLHGGCPRQVGSVPSWGCRG